MTTEASKKPAKVPVRWMLVLIFLIVIQTLIMSLVDVEARKASNF